MFDTVTCLLLSAIVLAVLYMAFSSYSRRNLPPFPTTPVPLLGNLLSMEKDPRRLFAKWRKKHGDIFSLYLGQNLFIVLNGYDTIKEALVTFGDYFSDRPLLFFQEPNDKLNLGIMLSTGKNWQVQRAVSTSILRSLGMGKNILAEKMAEEAGCYLEALAQFHGKAVDIAPLTRLATANVICAMMEGKRRNYDDSSFLKLIENMNCMSSEITATNPIIYSPSLYHLPGDLFGGKEALKRARELFSTFKRRYLEQGDYVRSDGDSPSCFVDAYLSHMAKSSHKNNNTESSNLNMDNLVKLIMDIHTAGSESTSTTILWIVLYFLHYPEAQKRIQKEMDSEIGPHRTPSMQDKSKLRYLNATIVEGQRMASIAPLGLMHLASDTITFKGYTIPKGAVLAPNLDSVLFDPQTWGEDVHTFRPERHLDAQGKLVVREEFIPFSIGRRGCVGEGMAKMELYVFIASMLQTFSFQPEDPHNLPSLKAHFGLTASPQPYKVKIIRRDVE